MELITLEHTLAALDDMQYEMDLPGGAIERARSAQGAIGDGL